MKEITTEQFSRPESELDSEVVSFRKQFDSVSPLDGIVRKGAQQMLQTAIEAEVQDFLDAHSIRQDDQGRCLVVRNGFLPSREILTGVGPLEVQQPRVANMVAGICVRPVRGAMLVANMNVGNRHRPVRDAMLVANMVVGICVRPVRDAMFCGELATTIYISSLRGVAGR